MDSRQRSEVNGMNDKIFFDTSILIYAFDEYELRKKEVCEKLVKEVFDLQTNGIISNQVAAELFSVLTTKMRKPLSSENAEKIVRNFVDSEKWQKINYNIKTVKNAMFISKAFKTSFWDALIAETMKENGINKIITENIKDFKKIPGVKVINPF